MKDNVYFRLFQCFEIFYILITPILYDYIPFNLSNSVIILNDFFLNFRSDDATMASKVNVTPPPKGVYLAISKLNS